MAFEHLRRGRLDLGGRVRDDRRGHVDPIGRERRLGLRLRQHRTAFRCRAAEDRQHGIAVAGDVLAAARRHAHQRLLGLGPVAEIGDGSGGVGGGLEARHARILKDAPSGARGVLAEPAGQHRLAVHLAAVGEVRHGSRGLHR